MNPWILRRVIKYYDYRCWVYLRKHEKFSVTEALWDLVKHIENCGYYKGMYDEAAV